MTPFLRTLRVGLKSLMLHKLRAALAVLGIFIGVTAVIWLVAMGEGVSYQAQEQIKGLGATNIIVRTVMPPQQSSRATAGSPVTAYGLLRDDYERIAKGVPTLKQAAPMRELRREARNLDKTLDIRLVGCTPVYQEMNHLELARGRFLTDRDGNPPDNVAVIAERVADNLFPLQDPLGGSILIDNDFYVVVGVTKDRNPTAAIGGSFSGQDYNFDVYIPLGTLRARIGDFINTARNGFSFENVELSQITATVGDISEVDASSALIRRLLDELHPAPDFAIVVPKELLEQAEVLQMMFNVLLVLIAGIALLVGGIGIMNIMLATVTERTREIGIRRALGAKQNDIVVQFLSETVVLSATGGLLGVAFGFACTPVIATVRWLMLKLFPDVVKSLPSNIQNLEPRIALWSVVAAFLISVAVGVVFGLYPARRAAMMDPIEALRHE